MLRDNEARPTIRLDSEIEAKKYGYLPFAPVMTEG